MPAVSEQSPDPPDVSVIVLGFNGRGYVDPCLASVLDQDFARPYEVLFVDNGSRDGTAEAARRHERVRVHALPENLGYCRGNNLAARIARAPLLVFLNQDVVVHRSWLRELVAAVEGSPEVAAAQANVVHPWNREYAARDRFASPATAHAPDLSRLGFVEYREVPVTVPVLDTLFLSGVSLLLRRDVLPQIGGYVFDPDMFAYGEDLDLALRLRGAGYRTVIATRAVVHHDHTLADSPSLRSFLKTVRIIRNRLLAFWKNTGWREFLGLAAVTLVGAPLNSGQFGLSRARQVLYSLLLVPPTAVAAFALLLAMPRYAARRRDALAARRRRPGWLLRAMLSDRASLSAAAEPASAA